MIISFRAWLLLVVLITALPGCSSLVKPSSRSGPIPTPAPPPPQRVTVTAVGDLLMHMPVVNSARQPDGSYDFRPIFSEVADYLKEGDLTIANLETRLAGKEYGYSGYPVFNCPESLAWNLKELGVDVVTTANNHTLDHGWPGIVNTINNLESAGLDYVGTHQTKGDSDQAFITEVKGMKIGILNYTENTNGIPLPKGNEFSVDLIQPEKIFGEIDKLKNNGAEVIIAYLHFGTEYQRYPNKFQTKLVDDLFQRGVDIVFGDHVHVIQPIEYKKVSTAGGEKNCLVVYSLGNFISNQSWRYSNCGLITNVELEKSAGKVSIKNVDYIPVWVDTYVREGKLSYRVLPVQKAMEDYRFKSDPLLTSEDYIKLQEVWQDTTSLISETCPVIAPRNLTQKPI